jgi:hypothetical protein
MAEPDEPEAPDSGPADKKPVEPGPPAPENEAPATKVPGTGEPGAGKPGTGEPGTGERTTEPPKVEHPTTEMPKTDAPTTELPPADAPTVEATKADLPKAESSGAESSEAGAKTEVGPPPSARRGNLRLIIAIGLAVLVLSGGGVAIAIVASQPRPEDIALQQERTKAREVAQKFAVLLEQARNDGAFALAKSDVQTLLCASEQDALEQEWQDRESKEIMRSYVPSPAARLAITVKDVRIEGDHGVVTMTGSQQDSRRDQDYALVKEDSQWKVCGVTFRAPRSSTTSPQPTDSGSGEPTPGEGDPGSGDPSSTEGIDPSDIYVPESEILTPTMENETTFEY